MKPSISLIGPGKVGCAVAARLYASGHPVTAIVSRDLARAQDACQFIGCASDLATTELINAGRAQIILIAVPDDAITEVSTELQKDHLLSATQTLVHFSGLHPSSLLKSPEALLPGLLSLHPLLSFADRQQASQRLENCPCALEGNDLGLKTGELLVSNLQAVSFMLTADAKAAYHSAASVASNFLVTLLAAAVQLMDKCDIEEHKSLQLLEPLVRTTVDNLFAGSPEQALTGPIVRGDTTTVSSHLLTIESRQPQFLDLYLTLARHTLLLARRSGRLDAAQASRLGYLLREK